MQTEAALNSIPEAFGSLYALTQQNALHNRPIKLSLKAS
jgi:hypothetical protein